LISLFANQCKKSWKLAYTVEAFLSAADFAESRFLSETACLVVDVHMPGTIGIDLHACPLNLECAVPPILVTAYPNEAVRDQAVRDGVTGYLSKPVDDRDLERCLRSALKSPTEENS